VEKVIYKMFDAFHQGKFKLVLLRIPVFRDRDYRIFKPILNKGFESVHFSKTISKINLLDVQPLVANRTPNRMGIRMGKRVRPTLAKPGGCTSDT
jgi:hypothetical protein